MARQPLNIAGVDQIWQTILLDDEGKPLLEISAGEYIVHGPKGEITIRRSNCSIQLMCKQLWHPGPKAEPLGVCELCRKPPYKFPFREKPKHGLVTLKHANYCSGSCHLLLCPKHARYINDQFYCPSCAAKYRAKHVMTSLFFRYEEER